MGCAECHTRHDGRLEKLDGFYLPGRDYNRTLDASGSFLFFAALAGVILHAILRYRADRKRKRELLGIGSESVKREEL